MTPITIDSDSTRPKPRKSMRSNGFWLSWSTEPTRRLTSENTPIPDRIIHRTATMTTPAIPRATEIRNDIFIADHGSTRETVSFTRRLRAAAAGPPAVPAPAGRPCVGVGLAAPWTPWSGRGPGPWGRADVLVGRAVLTRYLRGRRSRWSRSSRRPQAPRRPRPADQSPPTVRHRGPRRPHRHSRVPRRRRARGYE